MSIETTKNTKENTANKAKTTVKAVDNSKDNPAKTRPLTVKQRKFVSNVVKGMPKSRAYRASGYKAATDQVARTEGSKLSTKPNVQQAIDKALEKRGATPEFAVDVLAQVAEQTEEIGARRLAAKDILELHGWRKTERPQSVLAINNAFFTDTRQAPPQG